MYARVDLHKYAEMIVNVQVKSDTLYEITYYRQIDVSVLDNSNGDKPYGVVYYTYLVISVPDEALLRHQFTSRRMKGWLWKLKHRSFRENFVAHAKRVEK